MGWPGSRPPPSDPQSAPSPRSPPEWPAKMQLEGPGELRAWQMAGAPGVPIAIKTTSAQVNVDLWGKAVRSVGLAGES